MEKRMQKITASGNKNIEIGVIPGHFATNHSHVNYYLDMTAIKSNMKMAREVANQLSDNYESTTPIDTIICLEGTQIIGAFLAQYLSEEGIHSLNTQKEIYVLTPEFNASNQMLFRDNTQNMIWNKNILLLISSASTGKTINSSIECLKYYSGRLVGISSIFSAIKQLNDIPIKTIFTPKDLPVYKTSLPTECEQCKANERIDAIVNSYGYSKI